MTLEKAISCLQTELIEGDILRGSIYEKSFKLGIEALKRVELQRNFPNNVIWETLPGETKEQNET